MKTIFEACTPRKDVLSGDLREEMFAAHLHDVIDNKADDHYVTAKTTPPGFAAFRMAYSSP